jgi:HSP20 family molecular chaperone IbpA
MDAIQSALRQLPPSVFADVLEADDAYRIVIDLPGVTADTLDLTTEDGRLQIAAHRSKDVPGSFQYLREERDLFIDAQLPLPPGVDATDAEATIERGVLTVTLPRTDGGNGARIAIEPVEAQ